MSITDFVMARIDEDLASATGSYDAPSYGDRFDRVSDCDCEGRHIACSYLAVDPAHVLAQCEALRRIVEQVQDIRWGSYAVRDVILEEIASMWSSHPDYDQAWSVTG